MINLEQITAKYAQGITECIVGTWPQGNPVSSSEAENYITKALGILQENGIYASIVYLLSKISNRGENNRYNPESTCCIYIVERLLALLGDPEIQSLRLGLNTEIVKEAVNTNDSKSRILNHITNSITNTIDNMLIVYRLFEQTLIFAKYGAKALD